LKNISLLPPEIRARQEARRKSRVLLLGSTAVLALFLVVYGSLFAIAWQAQAELRGLRTEREALQRELPAYQQYISIQQQVEHTDKLLKDAMGRSPDWASILTGLGLHIPEGVWLTDLALAYKAGEEVPEVSPGGSLPSNLPPALRPEVEEPRVKLGVGSELTVRGAAKSHALVAEWLNGIRQVPGLSDVFCQFASAEGDSEKTTIRFEIKAVLQPGAPYQPPVEGVTGNAGAI